MLVLLVVVVLPDLVYGGGQALLLLLLSRQRRCIDEEVSETQVFDDLKPSLEKVFYRCTSSSNGAENTRSESVNAMHEILYMLNNTKI